MLCTACAGELIKYGFTAAGKQRYQCKTCGNVIVYTPEPADGPSTNFLATWLRRVEARITELEEKVAFQDEEITRLELLDESRR
jgi:DNA-directed RNA polymerase subunit RPC12/RpoP